LLNNTDEDETKTVKFGFKTKTKTLEQCFSVACGIAKKLGKCEDTRNPDINPNVPDRGLRT